MKETRTALRKIKSLFLNPRHLKSKIAAVLAITVCVTNITPAATLGTPSRKEKAIKVTFQSGEGGYFAGIPGEDTESTKSNASKSNADRTKWVQTFKNLEKDDQGYFTNLILGVEEAEENNQEAVWESITNQANENEDDKDDLAFAGWYSYDSDFPMLVSDYKEIYSNVTLNAGWYNPEQIQGEAAERWEIAAIGLNDEKLIVSDVKTERDAEELAEWAGEALANKQLKIDGEHVIAIDAEIMGKEREITITLSVPKNALDISKTVSVIHEKENGKIEIIPADIVKADRGDGYKVTFTTDNDGAFYMVNTRIYRKPALSTPARANSNSGAGENAQNTETSGTLGDLTWKIEGTTLTISGSGEMPDWESSGILDDDNPWYTLRKGVESIVIEEGITRVGKRAFYHFYNATSIEIPGSVKEIGSYAFAFNMKLTSITIPDGVIKIEGEAFYRCDELIEVKLPDNGIQVDGNAFSECGKLPDTAVVGKGNCGENIKWELTNGGTLTIRGTEAIPDWNNSTIGENPWYSARTKVKKVMIENGITSIGSWAFRKFEYLTEIQIPNSVTNINSSAFIDCDKLPGATVVGKGVCGENIKWELTNEGTLTIRGTGAIPDWNNSTIRENPWYSARTKIKKVIIENGITSIGSWAFCRCLGLTEVKIPDSVVNIDSSAFYECENLNDTVVTGRGNFGEALVWEINNKGELTIKGTGPMPDADRPWRSVRQNIESINIGEGITSIGNYAFEECDKLVSVMIPESVSKIGKSVFSGCSSLNNVELPKSITEIDNNAFTGCTNLDDLKFSEGIIWIGESAFEGCTKLVNVVIPESVCRIERRAFWETAITSVVIPKSVIFLGQKSFPQGTQIVVNKIEDSSSEALKLTGNTSFASTDNAHKQNYPYHWSSVMNSYLYEGGDGIFYRVASTGKQTVIEQFKSDNTFVKSWNVPMELPKFGGFYAGNDYLYIVFGQDNVGESNDVEVIRVVKYSKDMERLSSSSIYGENTWEPFGASSLRMSEKDEYLYIRTGHGRYKSADGLNHQANMTVIINTEAMICSYIGDGNSNSYMGYVSHSFNQFIKIDGNMLVMVDHGDAYPREIVMNICPNDDVLDAPKSITLLSISGETGDNYTGVSLGGLEVSDNSYLVVGNTINQGHFDSSTTRNVFLSVVDKNALDNEANYIQITNYEENGSYSASTPQLVKISEDLFAIMWEEMLKSSSSWNGYTKTNGIVKVAFFDGEGNSLGDIEQFEGSLSDCQPIVLNGNVKWYVSSGSNLTFYTFPAKMPDFSSGLKVSKTTLRNSSSSGGSGSSSGGSSGGGGGGGSRSSGGSTSGGPGSSLPSYVVKGEWSILNGFWHFTDTSGNACINNWVAAYNPYAVSGQQNYDWFRFDPFGNMLTGWFTDADGSRYYLNPLSDGTLGKMMTGWVWIPDETGVQRCYYLNPNSDGYRGKMLTNTIIDGYTIDANGWWTVDGVVQVK